MAKRNNSRSVSKTTKSQKVASKTKVAAKKVTKGSKKVQKVNKTKVAKTSAAKNSKVSKKNVSKTQKKAQVKTVKAAKAPKPAKPAKPAKEPKVNSSASAAPASSVQPKASGPKGYTATQYQKYKQQKKRLASFNNNDLKAMLRKNLQSMSGNKDQLIEKIADGIVLGRIPRCPACFGGRPKFDYKKGTYYCSGYRDDQDFKNCHTSFNLQELKRDPWEA